MAVMRSPPPRRTVAVIEADARAARADATSSRMDRGRDAASVRGDEIAMIFQEPMTSLNPVLHDRLPDRGGASILHRGLSASERPRAETCAALRRPCPHTGGALAGDATIRMSFSGGMRQRAMIAMALACQPSLLIADEPTTALDVTIQAQILSLLAELRDSTGMSVLLITHNLGVVAAIADTVAVMYAGRIVEYAPATALLNDAQHPYTLALLAATPSLDAGADRLEPIPGRMPSPGHAPEGCRFAPRCPFAITQCETQPPLRPIGPAHDVACWRAPIA